MFPIQIQYKFGVQTYIYWILTQTLCFRSSWCYPDFYFVKNITVFSFTMMLSHCYNIIFIIQGFYFRHILIVFFFSNEYDTAKKSMEVTMYAHSWPWCINKRTIILVTRSEKFSRLQNFSDLVTRIIICLSMKVFDTSLKFLVNEFYFF